MVLSPRQNLPPVIYDDQAPGLSHGYVGAGWLSGTTTLAPHYNSTFTETITPGDSFWFTFNGSKATVICCAGSAGNSSGAPSISLYVDGISAGSQQNFIGSDSRTVGLETQQLLSGTHVINATVVHAGPANSYCIDYFEVVTDDSSTSSSPGAAGPTSSSTQNVGTSSSPGALGPHKSHTGKVGAIAAGGVIILVVLFIMCYLLRKKYRNRQSQGNKRRETDLRGTFRKLEPSYSGFGGRDSQSLYSNKDSNNPLLSSDRQSEVKRPASPSGSSDIGLGLALKTDDADW